jgi:hypothetical protein
MKTDAKREPQDKLPGDTLQRALDAMPRDQLPGRDLWPGIEHAINEARPRAAWGQYAALAASLLLLLFASLQFGRIPAVPGANAGIDRELLAELQSEHLQSKQALLVRYEEAAPLYPAWETQMQQLEQAEQVIYNALREEPSNLELLKMLRLVQQKQLELIDSVFSPRLTNI